ncbi:hypothetical protein JHK87_000190 [Glycine soja]|nr:hypothetical protein JHK87_000190 [Glycine soja]
MLRSCYSCIGSFVLNSRTHILKVELIMYEELVYELENKKSDISIFKFRWKLKTESYKCYDGLIRNVEDSGLGGLHQREENNESCSTSHRSGPVIANPYSFPAIIPLSDEKNEIENEGREKEESKRSELEDGKQGCLHSCVACGIDRYGRIQIPGQTLKSLAGTIQMRQGPPRSKLYS